MTINVLRNLAPYFSPSLSMITVREGTISNYTLNITDPEKDNVVVSIIKDDSLLV